MVCGKPIIKVPVDRSNGIYQYLIDESILNTPWCEIIYNSIKLDLDQRPEVEDLLKMLVNKFRTSLISQP
jgi:hypothetical protein